jgi:hypothetical protein
MIPGPDVHGGCNSCAEAVEGAEKPAEAADCRIFHYPSADWRRGRCCDKVACMWTWLRRRSGCYQPLTSPLDSSCWFGWASIRVPFFIYFHFESNCQHTQKWSSSSSERNPTQYPLWLRSSSWLSMQSSHAQPDTFNQRLNDENQ